MRQQRLINFLEAMQFVNQKVRIQIVASASQAHTADCTLVELGFITTNCIDEALSCQMAG